MNVCLFDVSEEDYYSLVFKYIADLLNTDKEVSKLVENEGSRFLELFGTCNNKDEEGQLTEESIPKVLTLFIEKIPVLFEQGTDHEAETCVQLMSHLLSRLSARSCQDYTNAFSTALSATVDSKAEIRLACLLHLYNACCQEQDQYYVILGAIDYALKADLTGVLSAVLKDRVDGIVSKWRLSPSAASKLYFGVAKLLRKSTSEKEASPQAMVLTSKALSLIESLDSGACKEVANEAAEAITDFLRSKKLMTCDLLELAPVKALTKNPTYFHLHQLFSAVTKGQIDQLEQVCRPELLKTVGINHELCLEKARVAMLLNVAKRFSHKPIPYQEFANALEISYEEVEQWIVKAIGEGLLTARIDQIRELVSVTSCANRGFEDDDWQRLKIQLNEWKDMLVSMEQTMADTMVSETSQHSALRIQ